MRLKLTLLLDMAREILRATSARITVMKMLPLATQPALFVINHFGVQMRNANMSGTFTRSRLQSQTNG